MSQMAFIVRLAQRTRLHVALLTEARFLWTGQLGTFGVYAVICTVLGRALIAVRVEASIVWRADGLAWTSKLTLRRTLRRSVKIALLAEFFETVVGKLLVCVDVRVRVWLCGDIVELGHLVRRGPALGRAVAAVAAGVWAVGATQGLWIDVFSAVLARCRGLGWLQLSVIVADIIGLALAAGHGEHGIKETLVQSRVDGIIWEAISRGHGGVWAWARANGQGGRVC
jgi:hypothetical protein